MYKGKYFDEVMEYAQKCIDGRIRANKYRKKACQRFIDDLKNEKWDFDAKDCDFVIGIIATKTPILGYSAHDYLLIVAMTFVCQIGAHAVFNLCFGYVDSLYVSAWESGESVFAIVLGIIFLGQIPEGWEIVGCAVVVTGLLYYNYHTGIAEKEALKNQGGSK